MLSPLAHNVRTPRWSSVFRRPLVLIPVVSLLASLAVVTGSIPSRAAWATELRGRYEVVDYDAARILLVEFEVLDSKFAMDEPKPLRLIVLDRRSGSIRQSLPAGDSGGVPTWSLPTTALAPGGVVFISYEGAERSRGQRRDSIRYESENGQRWSITDGKPVNHIVGLAREAGVLAVERCAGPQAAKCEWQGLDLATGNVRWRAKNQYTAGGQWALGDVRRTPLHSTVAARVGGGPSDFSPKPWAIVDVATGVEKAKSDAVLADSNGDRALILRYSWLPDPGVLR